MLGRSRFTLHIRCFNCLRERAKDIEVCESGPMNVEELIESGLLSQVKFSCFHCDSVIGQLIAITNTQDECVSSGPANSSKENRSLSGAEGR